MSDGWHQFLQSLGILVKKLHEGLISKISTRSQPSMGSLLLAFVFTSRICKINWVGSCLIFMPFLISNQSLYSTIPSNWLAYYFWGVIIYQSGTVLAWALGVVSSLYYQLVMQEIIPFPYGVKVHESNSKEKIQSFIGLQLICILI